MDDHPGPMSTTDDEVRWIEAADIRVGVIPFGASLVAVEVPDRSGVPCNVILSLPTAVDYRDRRLNHHLGATVGRFANRIAGASFDLDGVTHRLVASEGDNTLHGGPAAWGRRDWTPTDHTADSVALRLVDPDGTGGFPGTVDAELVYRVEPGILHIDAQAVTDAPTLLNMANHAYWNLAGTGPIDGQELAVAAGERLEVGTGLIPTGELVPTRISGLLGHSHWDDALVLEGGAARGEVAAAELRDRGSGRVMTVYTNQPALQVYTADGLGPPFGPRWAVCLEAQGFPDAPHHPEFPSAVVRPGEHYHWWVRHEFTTADEQRS